MNTTLVPPGKNPVEESNFNLFVAWSMALLFPVFFLIGFAAAHIPYFFWNYEEGSGTEPMWFGILCILCFMAVQAVPVWVMWKFGHLAVKDGHSSGIYAYWIGAAWGLGLLALMIISALVNQFA